MTVPRLFSGSLNCSNIYAELSRFLFILHPYKYHAHDTNFDYFYNPHTRNIFASLCMRTFSESLAAYIQLRTFARFSIIRSPSRALTFSIAEKAPFNLSVYFIKKFLTLQINYKCSLFPHTCMAAGHTVLSLKLPACTVRVETRFGKTNTRRNRVARGEIRVPEASLTSSGIGWREHGGAGRRIQSFTEHRHAPFTAGTRYMHVGTRREEESDPARA